jgi:hypothetical protein
MKTSDAYEEYASSAPPTPAERQRAARHSWTCTSSAYEQSTHRCSACFCVKVVTRHAERLPSVRYIDAAGKTHSRAPACPRQPRAAR